LQDGLVVDERGGGEPAFVYIMCEIEEEQL